MASKEEIREIIQEVLNDQDEKGMTIIGREINRHVDLKANQIVSQLTLRFAIPFIAVIIAGTGAWYTLQRDVADTAELVEQDGRYTQKEHEVYSAAVAQELARQQEQLNQQQTQFNKLAEDMRKDIRDILNLLYTRQ